MGEGGEAGKPYSFCPPARDGVVRARGPVKDRRLGAGPLVAALEARQSLRGGRVGVRLVVMLHADSAAVRCVLEIDNRAAPHRVRARLPTALKGRAAGAGAPFGARAPPPAVAPPPHSPLATPLRP